jgi:hypothetical protein
MRLAYLGYDKNVIKSYATLAGYFQQIDTYLLNYDNEINNSDIYELPVMAANVYISKEHGFQTEQHKLVLRKINLEHNMLKKSISSVDKIELNVGQDESKCDKNYFKIVDIADINFDKKINKYFIQTKQQVSFEYDYIIVQDHKIVSELFKRKNQNLFKGESDQFYAMLNLDFSIKANLTNEVSVQEFIFVENTQVKSIFDNWFICKISQHKISINFYIPFKQRHNEEFIDFLIQRTRATFGKTFITFKMGDILNKSILTTNGFAKNHISTINKQSSFIFPSFSYWSEKRVAGFIHNVFLAKNKKNKLFFSEKENT